MPSNARDAAPSHDRSIEARLRLGDDDVIAGTVCADEEEPAPFHGWLELMDALEGIRNRALRRPAA